MHVMAQKQCEEAVCKAAVMALELLLVNLCSLSLLQDSWVPLEKVIWLIRDVSKLQELLLRNNSNFSLAGFPGREKE